MKKILLIFGTRSEAIKMAPVYMAFKAEGTFDAEVCVTAQHRQMLDHVLEFFKIQPHYDLNIMKADQTLNTISASIIAGLDEILAKNQYSCVLVHGDTTTACSASLAAFHRKIPVVHVEAGLRTYDLQSPWPEEMNRQITDKLSDLLFAPTEDSRANLLKEGHEVSRIFVTGNTVIDALLKASDILENDSEIQFRLSQKFSFLDKSKKLVLVTGHRRESFGQQFDDLCRGIKKIAERDDVQVVYPVHLNPNVQEPVNKILRNCPNVFLIEPQSYPNFVYLMQRSQIILTDSGGIQEEAPSLKKPVLVMRETTERPEAITAGTAKLVGTSSQKIFLETCQLLDNPKELHRIQTAQNPYGDGKASLRIVEQVKRRYV